MLLKNGFYNTAAGAIRIGLAVLTIPLLIRLIGVNEYGLWTLASTVVALVTLAEAGLSVATTVFVSQDLGKDDVDALSKTLTVIIGAMLILATLAALTLEIGAQTIVSLFPKLEQAQQLRALYALQIGGLVVWAQLFQQVLVGVEQAYQRYDLMNLVNTIQSVLLTLGMLVVAWLGGQTVALMKWQALVSILALAAHMWLGCFLVKKIKISFNFDITRCFFILKYSLMIWLTSLSSILFSKFDRVIVAALLGTESLGVYAAITSITSQINILSAVAVQPILPELSNLIVNLNLGENLKLLKKQIKQAFKLNILIASGMGAGLFTFAPFLMHFVIVSEVSDKYTLVFRIAVLIYTTYSMNAVGFYILLAIDAVRINLIINLLSSTLSLVLIYILCVKSGLIGAVLGNAGYLVSLLFIPFALKEIHLLTIKKMPDVITR